MNVTYFKYLSDKFRFPYLILEAIYIVIFALVITFIKSSNIYVLKKLIYFPTTILIILGYVIPVLDFRYYYNQTSANIYLSLPDRRINIYRTSTYYHLLMNIITFSLGIMAGILVLLVKGIEINYSFLFVYLLLMIGLFTSVYFVSGFIASISYTFIDGVVLNLAYIALPALILFALYFALNQKNLTFGWHHISFIGMADFISSYYIQLSLVYLGEFYIPWLSYLLMIAVGLMAHGGSLVGITKFKSEKVGMPTRSIFGYRLIIPLYCLLIFIIANYQTGVTFVVVFIVLAICYICFSLFAKKELKFEWKVIVQFLILLGVANLIVFLLSR